MPEDFVVYTPLSVVLPEGFWPEDLFSSCDENFLDKFACLHYDEKTTENGFTAYVRTQVISEVRFTLPFLEGLSLVLGRGEGEEVGLIDVDLFMEFNRGFLRLP